MPLEKSMPRQPARYSVPLIYAAVSATWIATSDFLLDLLAGGTALQTVKGVAFVVVTSLMLHALVQRYAVRVRDYERRLQERARFMDLGHLNAIVSHELRNVLMAAKTMTSVLRRHLSGAPQGETAVRHMEAAFQRAETLLAEILSFAAPHPARTAPIVLGPWLDDFVESIRLTVRENVALQISGVPDDLVVHADSVQFHLLLTTLVMNAHEAAAGGGRIAISAAAREVDSAAGVVVTVSDDGVGMPPEVAHRVFEPLFTTKTHGTGLGLPIAQRIATAHRGSITFESEPGHGTAFHAFFPDPESFTRVAV